MDLSENLGVVGGVCLVPAALFILVLPGINGSITSALVKSFLIEISLLIFLSSFIAHIQAYARVGEKIGSKFLLKASYFLIFSFAAYGIFTMALLWTNPLETTSLQNTITGFLASVCILASIAFGAAIILTLTGRAGLSTILASPIGLVPLFIFQPWLGIVLPFLSTLFLLKLIC
jgi:hypothetical protein